METGDNSSQTFLPFPQSAVYAVAAEACGARVREIDLGIGHALAVERGHLRLISRGPVWEEGVSATDKRRALRRLARWPGLTLVTPEECLSGFGLIPLVTPTHHVLWGLGPDLRKGMARNWRNHMVSNEKAGMIVSPGDTTTLEILIEAELAQRTHRRYRTLSPGFTRALPPEALRLWQWRDRGQVEAAMMFVRHGSTATYHLAWGSEAARKTGIHALMLTRAAEALRDEGVRWLDLGSVNTEQAPGLARFKLGTGADLRRLGPTLLVLP